MEKIQETLNKDLEELKSKIIGKCMSEKKVRRQSQNFELQYIK